MHYFRDPGKEDNAMSELKEQIYTGSNCIEVQYYFEEETHLMDALVQNKCEYELLALIKEVAARFRLSIHIETAPLAEKGFRWRFKVALKKDNKTGPVAITIATAVLVAMIASPLTVSAGKEARQLIDELIATPDFEQFTDEKTKTLVEKRVQQMIASCNNLDASNVLKKRRSNFFELLKKYPRINRVQLTALDEQRFKITQEKTITRQQFDQQILTSDVLEPEEIDNVDIEIISPVLKKSNYKWVGVYNGKARSFTMLSKEFNKLVQSGKVEFKNGTIINCQISIHKKINSEGTERITGMTIDRVNQYFENDKPVETNEGKKQKKQPEQGPTQQLALFM